MHEQIKDNDKQFVLKAKDLLAHSKDETCSSSEKHFNTLEIEFEDPCNLTGTYLGAAQQQSTLYVQRQKSFLIPKALHNIS